MVGIIIPALTASNPSRIIALRVKGTLNGLHCWFGWLGVFDWSGMALVLSVHLVFGQRHQQVEHLSGRGGGNLLATRQRIGRAALDRAVRQRVAQYRLTAGIEGVVQQR